MALILRDKKLRMWPKIYYKVAVPEPIKNKAGKLFIEIPAYFLSAAYDLDDGSLIKGKILELKLESKVLKEFEGKEISFVLYCLAEVDHLFISKESWEEYREYGLVVPGFIISVKLEKAITKEGKEIQLYTKKDVIV